MRRVKMLYNIFPAHQKIPSVRISVRDYRKMLAVVRAAERLMQSPKSKPIGEHVALSDALDAFNALPKRKLR